MNSFGGMEDISDFLVAVRAKLWDLSLGELGWYQRVLFYCSLDALLLALDRFAYLTDCTK